MRYDAMHGMESLPRYVYFAALAILGLAIGYSLWGIQEHSVRFDAQGRVVAAEEGAYWAQRIRVFGGPAAYTEFARAVENLTPRQQHSAAHVFGDALFENASLREGIGTCDSRFTMGCFHALFGAAAVTMGTDSFLNEMQTACTGRTRGMERLCLHGVGHGILGSIGYETEDLVRALELCERIPDAGNITTGCWGGAFMEHNVQTLISLDSPERPLSEENMFEPCLVLPEKYRNSCMFWQPTWWHVALSRALADREIFGRMAMMCRSAPSAALGEACIKGIGFRATWTTGYDADLIAPLCAQMQNTTDRLICWDTARNDLRKDDAEHAAPAVCVGLEMEEYHSCSAAAGSY